MLSIPLTLACSAVPWHTLQAPRWLLAIGLVVGIALATLGAVFSLAFYPWTDLVVLLVALLVVSAVIGVVLGVLLVP